MEQAYIVDAVRTPIGKFGGGLADVRPDDLSAHVIKAILGRNPGLDPALIEDVIFGAANQAGEDNRNVARMASLMAGVPPSVPGYTVNRLCASGMQALIDATLALRGGIGSVYLAGGVESMTRAPFVMAKSNGAFQRSVEIYDTTIGWRFTNPKLADMYYPYSMGETAENVAEKYHISREDQDEFAYQSNLKYKQALEAGKWTAEMVPYPVPQKKGDPVMFATDEQHRLSTVETLATLKPAFRKNGTVTAGNSAGINDGAACHLIVSESALKELGLKPLARIASFAAAGVDPAIMGIGPVPATLKAVERAGLKMSDIGLAEFNEAFAAQALASVRETGIDPSVVNVNGGSIAIGHPLGCSGARITGTLLHEMQRRDVRYGLATMCIGVGQGLAIVLEKC